MAKLGPAIVIIAAAILAVGILGAGSLFSIYTFAIGAGTPQVVVYGQQATTSSTCIFQPTPSSGVYNLQGAYGLGGYAVINVTTQTTSSTLVSQCLSVGFPAPSVSGTITDVQVSASHYETGTGCGGNFPVQLTAQLVTQKYANYKYQVNPGTASSPTTTTLDIFTMSPSWNSTSLSQVVANWWLNGGPCKTFVGSFALTVFTSAAPAPGSSSTSSGGGPVASFTYSPSPATINQAVTFNAQGTTGPNMISSYAWTFGDGTTGTGVMITHNYAAVGNYNVTLTVTDTTSQKSSVTATVNVQPGSNPYCTSCSPGTSGTGTATSGYVATYQADWFGAIDQPLGIAARPDLNVFRVAVEIFGVALLVVGIVVWRRKEEAD